MSSLNFFISEAGSIEQELSFAARSLSACWRSNRRDPATWQNLFSTPSGLITDRGYTGHLHLDGFKLINMNGRVYDPVLGMFLSPDNFVQDAGSTQDYNRYSYCGNNPLIYTDPSGWIKMPQVPNDFDGAGGGGGGWTGWWEIGWSNNIFLGNDTWFLTDWIAVPGRELWLLHLPGLHFSPSPHATKIKNRTISNYFKPLQTILNYFEPSQTLSNYLKPLQTVSNPFPHQAKMHFTPPGFQSFRYLNILHFTG